MSLIILPDAGPSGMIANPKSSPENEGCKAWLASVESNGADVMIPEIADRFVLDTIARMCSANLRCGVPDKAKLL